jgi:hypothetical protein
VGGEHNQFEVGWKAPNDGVYREIGEHPDSEGISHPREIHLKKGEPFPEPTNAHRKWTRVKNGDVKYRNGG